MKTITILLSILLVQQFYAQVESTSTITVVVEDLKSNDGAVRASLFTEKTFLSSNPEFTAESKIADGKAVLIFKNVPAGTYGITVFHDQNNNGKMDFEASGMPTEDYGISNNKFNPYGPPQWNDAKFEFSGTAKEFRINLTR